MESLKFLFQFLVRLKDKDEEERAKAIDAFSKALMETELYVANLDAGKPKDRAKEEELARLWRISSLYTKVLNDDWPIRDADKMWHWIYGAEKDVESLEERGLSLTQLRKDLEEIHGYYRDARS